MLIRRYKPSDVSQVISIINRSGMNQTEEEFERELDEPGERIRENTFVAVKDEVIVGHIRLCFVQTAEKGHFHEFCFGNVDPEKRKQGIGNSLYTYVMKHLHGLSVKENASFTLIQHVDESMRDQIRLLDKKGFIRSKSILGLKFEGKLNHLLCELPSGYQIRSAKVEDAGKCAHIYNQAFHWRNEQVMMSVESVRYECSSPHYIPELHPIITQIDGTGSAYANCSIINHDQNKLGKINTIAVLPSEQGKGLGKYLLSYCIHTLKQLEVESIVLSVESDNPTPALSMYKSFGFSQVKEIMQYRLKIERPGI